jgi:hypothetical protein
VRSLGGFASTEAKRRKVDLVVLPTSKAIEILKGEPKATNAVLHNLLSVTLHFRWLLPSTAGSILTGVSKERRWTFANLQLVP